MLTDEDILGIESIEGFGSQVGSWDKVSINGYEGDRFVQIRNAAPNKVNNELEVNEKNNSFFISTQQGTEELTTKLKFVYSEDLHGKLEYKVFRDGEYDYNNEYNATDWIEVPESGEYINGVGCVNRTDDIYIRVKDSIITDWASLATLGLDDIELN